MFINALNIAGSGMNAQRTKLDIISQNIANQDTTRTDAGTPYRRQTVTFQAVQQQVYTGLLGSTQGPGGVTATVGTDNSGLKLTYDPSDPDADANGYVQMPNIDLTQEMTDMMAATRSYESDVTAFNALKGMAVTALNIGK